MGEFSSMPLLFLCPSFTAILANIGRENYYKNVRNIRPGWLYSIVLSIQISDDDPQKILGNKHLSHLELRPSALSPTMSTIGIPIKLLHEAQGHIVTVELSNGDVYRGQLFSAGDDCNVQLLGVTMTARNGQVRPFEHIFIRGSHVLFFVVPEMLRLAPLFKNGRGLRRGGEVKVSGRGMRN
jgi:small nuclear ribonucleoprotein D3